MDRCCDAEDLGGMAARQEQRRTLVAVLLVNAVLFPVDLSAGMLPRLAARLGDSLDMLGGALVYGFALYVLQRSARVRLRVAVIEGLIMVEFVLFVLGEAGVKILDSVHAAGRDQPCGGRTCSARDRCLGLPTWSRGGSSCRSASPVAEANR